MKKSAIWFITAVSILTLIFELGTRNCEAFFVGFGSAGAAEQVITKGQELGLIPKAQSETTPAGPIQYKNAEMVWQKTWDGGVDEMCMDLAIDNTGNVYVVGLKNNDCLIIKYNSDGNTIWQSTWDGGIDDEGWGIAVDLSGNVYVTGYSYNGADYDLATIKYNSGGNTEWQKIWNAGGNDRGYGVTVDSSGNIYVTGNSTGGGNDFLLVKYDSSGNTTLQKVWGTGNNEKGYDIAVDLSGNIYIAGQLFNGTDYDYAVIKCDSSGNVLWQKSYDGGNNDYGYGIAVDSSGRVYMNGMSFDAIGTDYIATIKYDSNGDTIWQKRILSGGAMDPRKWGIALDNTGNAYVAADRLIDGSREFFTVKYDSNGDTVWQKSYGHATRDDVGNGITVDSSGNVYVAGYFYNGSNDDVMVVKYRQY